MKVLRKNELKIIEGLVKLNQPSMLQTMRAYLEKYYDQVITTKEYIIAKGSIPIALVAHADTVFPKPPENVYYDMTKGVLWSPEGLGADDRAGIFAIIQIIKTTNLRPSIIITTDEELGACGAYALIDHMEKPFDNFKYLIQLDRRGTNDAVFYDCDNPEFTKYVESFGFTEAIGTFSDISVICPAWKVAGVNLSIGYKDEHSKSEILFVNPMFSTINKVINMLKDADNSQYFDFIEATYSYTSYWDTWFDDKKNTTKVFSHYNKSKNYKNNIESYSHCSKCHMPYFDYEMIPVKKTNGNTEYICVDCIDSTIEWCNLCGEAFEIPKGVKNECICEDCKEKEGK